MEVGRVDWGGDFFGCGSGSGQSFYGIFGKCADYLGHGVSVAEVVLAEGLFGTEFSGGEGRRGLDGYFSGGMVGGGGCGGAGNWCVSGTWVVFFPRPFAVGALDPTAEGERVGS